MTAQRLTTFYRKETGIKCIKNQTFADVKHRKDVCEVSENDEVKETRQQSLVSSST